MSDFATDNCNDGMKRVAFLNPVLLNPWRSVVPLEFCKRFHSCGNYVKCASSSKKVSMIVDNKLIKLGGVETQFLL